MSKVRLLHGFALNFTLITSLLVSSSLLQAHPAHHEKQCKVGTDSRGKPICLCVEAPCVNPCPYCSGDSVISLSEGNLTDQYQVAQIKSAFGATIDFSLTYNSDSADGSRRSLDTVLGFGWTHSYNIFLAGRGAIIFRTDGTGRITKFQAGAGGIFTPTTGYFETLVQNPDGSFTLTQKDQTVFHFALIPDTPFTVEGSPVYRLTSIVDRNHNTTTLVYSTGNLTRITDTYGRILTLVPNNQNKLAAVIDPLGRTTVLTYDPSGTQLRGITDPDGQVTEYAYNDLFQLTVKADRDGRLFFFRYADGKPVAVQDAAGDLLFNLRNPLNWAPDDRNQVRFYVPATTSRSDGRGNVWEYEYEEHGYLSRITAPDGATSSYTYDPATLKVASATDANGHRTVYEYDAVGNRTKITDALLHVTTFTYEPLFSQMTSMTDANRRVTVYTVDPSTGNRLRETDPLGATLESTYDSHGNVVTEKDKNGNVTAYRYDAFGNHTTMIDAVGNVTMMTYDTVGNVISRTNARGFTTTYQYDGLDRLINETDPLGHTTQTFYDGQGNRVAVIDRNGNPTTFEYDLRQRLVTTSDALNQIMTHTYDRNNNRTSVSDKNGHTTSFEYDVQNRLTKTTDALGNMMTMTYDGVGNKLSETDANGHPTLYQYDALNRMIERTDAELNVTQLLYDMVGMSGCPQCTGPTEGSRLVTKQIDAELKVTYFKYDAIDRLLLQIRKEGDTADVIDSSDAVTRYTYDAHGNRLTLTEPNGNTTTYAYDGLNRRATVTNAAGDITRTTYDPVSNVQTLTAPNRNVTIYRYDALDRLIQVDDELGRVASYTYDAVGNRLTEKDGNGNGPTNTFDPIYHLIDVTDALGRTTYYQYDAVGNLFTLTDREGNATTYLYDAINRRIQLTDALGNLTQYQYDAVGNLTVIIDTNRHATTFAYDRINRLTKETHADGRMRVFTYDRVSNLKTRTDQKGQLTSYVYNDLYFLLQRIYPVSPADNMTYDLSRRLLTAERGGWLVTFDYDGANRVTHTTQNGEIIAYLYDIPGRTRTLTYPGGRTITEKTDARRRLDTIDDMASPPHIVQYSYDFGNRVVSRTYRNSTTASYTYNANDWILTLDHDIASTSIAGFAYDFDNEGNKRFEQRLHDRGNSEAYQYDEIYRLIDFKVGTLFGSTVPVPLTQTQYELDGVDNWKKKIKDGVPENRMHSATNEITQIDAVLVLSDPNGNTREDEEYRYDYDEENRLSAVIRNSDGRVVGQYTYDALSRRVARIADSSTVSSPVETRYVYDGARVIEEQTPVGANPAMTTAATYVYGNYIDEILTMDRSGQTFYYHQNSVWSVEALTDSAANVIERYSYNDYGCVSITNGAGVPIPLNSWGTAHSASANPYRFTGRELDEETGLYYYRARYYDCVKGRFLQRDPLGYVRIRTMLAKGTIGEPAGSAFGLMGLFEAKEEAELLQAGERALSTRLGQSMRRDLWRQIPLHPSARSGYNIRINLYAAYFVPNTVDPTGEYPEGNNENACGDPLEEQKYCNYEVSNVNDHKMLNGAPIKMFSLQGNVAIICIPCPAAGTCPKIINPNAKINLVYDDNTETGNTAFAPHHGNFPACNPCPADGNPVTSAEIDQLPGLEGLRPQGKKPKAPRNLPVPPEIQEKAPAGIPGQGYGKP